MTPTVPGSVHMIALGNSPCCTGIVDAGLLRPARRCYIGTTFPRSRFLSLGHQTVSGTAPHSQRCCNSPVQVTLFRVTRATPRSYLFTEGLCCENAETCGLAHGKAIVVLVVPNVQNGSCAGHGSRTRGSKASLHQDSSAELISAQSCSANCCHYKFGTMSLKHKPIDD